VSFVKKSIFNTVSASAPGVLSVLFAFLFLGAANVWAASYYIAPNGIDGNDGLTINTPWRTVVKGIRNAKPGDTVYLREGIYRQNMSLGADSSVLFSTKATANSRITFKSYPGEMAVITSMKLRNSSNDWKLVDGYDHVYSTDLTPQKLGPDNVKVSRISNCSQNGKPLKLMTHRDLSAGPEALTGSGQWVRDVRCIGPGNAKRVWKLYVWSIDGKNPGLQKTEFSEFLRGGTNTIELQCNRKRKSNKRQADYLTFDSLTIEGGYYPIMIETDNIEIKNCIIRNSYGDAIKVGGARPADFDKPDDPKDPNYYNSRYGFIENCNIYNFGEQGIDITGGDYWVVRNNEIHHNVNNRGDLPGGTKASGIMLKNNSIGTIVEGNKIHNLDTAYGAIQIGGASFGGIAEEGVKIIAKNNIIHDISGPYVIAFTAAIDCEFSNNQVYDCNLTQAVVEFRLSTHKKPVYNNRNCKLKNNIFYNNKANYGTSGQMHLMYFEYQPGCMVGMESDNNVFDPNLKFYFNGSEKTFKQFKALGYDSRSRTSVLTVGEEKRDI
jgi:hypothetical protein